MLKKILIVEDNLDLLEMYQVVFTNHFEVFLVQNGKQAFSIIKNHHPDLILLDIMMPYINGYQFLHQFRNKNKHTIVVINSNLDQAKEVEKSFTLGANYYFKKVDYTPLELFNKIKQITL